MENASKLAIVTGASAGIGRATALALADSGCHVALVARRKEKLDAVAEDIEKENGDAEAFPADISAKTEIERVFNEVQNLLGSPDILVNCAGTVYREPVVTGEPDEWERELQVNLLGVMTSSRIALGRMLDAGSGHIVNVSSLNARKAAPGASGYSASKSGVNGFSEALRQEVTTEGIRVTVVEPGAVDTDMQPEEVKEMFHVLDPEDVANAIVYAVSQPEHVSINNIQIRPTDQEF